LRFNRDRRGYETTALVHTPRRKGRGQARILYWFRTPPGVRVGRAAIDEDAIRQLEQHNPEVQFDWTRILKQPVSTDSSQRRSGGRPPDEELPRKKQDSGRRQEPIRREPTPPADSMTERSSAEVDETVQPAEPAVEDEVTLSEQSAAEELGATNADEARQPAALARLGAEGLARLRARYAEVMARIADRVADDEIREELKTRAERLNPDAWVTDEEVQQGLEQYETVFESLRSVVGHSRRRRRRRM
jgi:hypothetical protein